MTVNFTKFKMFTDISRTNAVEVNIAAELANSIYKAANGIAAHDLALRIYRSEGEIELSDTDIQIIENLNKTMMTPLFIDAWENAKSTT